MRRWLATCAFGLLWTTAIPAHAAPKASVSFILIAPQIDVELTLFTSRPSKDRDGTFMLLISPLVEQLLTNQKLTAGKEVTLSEIYPTHLPDLLPDSQLVVLGRYKGEGHTTLRLTGKVGKETHEYVREVNFRAKTSAGEGPEAFLVAAWEEQTKLNNILERIRSNGGTMEAFEKVARKSELYFTGGLLPAGVHQLPHDVDLDVIGAIIRVCGPRIHGATAYSNLDGTLILSSLGNRLPRLLTVMRTLPNRTTVSIHIDTHEALRDPRLRISVQPGDVLILEDAHIP